MEWGKSITNSNCEYTVCGNVRKKNIVRLWNEELLNYDFVNRIKQSNKIDEIVDDRLMIDEKSI